MLSRNKREGHYTGNRRVDKNTRVRTGDKYAVMSYKKFNRDWFNAMAYVHWQDGIIDFHPLCIEIYPDYLY